MEPPSSFVLTRANADVPINLKPTDLQPYIDRKVSLSLAPNSKFNNGAVGMGASKGVLYLGVNVDLPGLPNQSIHSVQFLIANLALNSERELHGLAISTDGSDCRLPCGLCVRILQEINSPDIKILIKNKVESKDLARLHLRPEDNIPANYYGLLKSRNNGLTLLNPDKGICPGSDYDGHKCTNLECMGLVAANKSYAPYSECQSGVALRGSDDKVYIGWYMESFAYDKKMHDPSLGPLQVALVDFVARTGGNKFNEIKEVVLVEKKYANVRQEDMVRSILQKIAHPNCDFKIFNCSKPVEP